MDDREAIRWLTRVSAGIGHPCGDYSPGTPVPYICSKRRGHRGHHCALAPEFSRDRIRLRAVLTWRRFSRREATPLQDAGDGSPTTRGGDRQA